MDFFAVDGAGTFVAGGKGGWARGHTVIESTVIAKCVGKVIGWILGEWYRPIDRDGMGGCGMWEGTVERKGCVFRDMG